MGTARYRFCLSVLVSRRAPDPLSRTHLMTAAFLAPLRDRVPWLRDRWQTVRLVEQPHVVTWTVGPATDFDVLNEVLVLGEYDDLQLRSTRVILDLGSHIGVSILRLRAAYPDAHIYGFEPDPGTFARLARNVTQLRDVTVLPWAIGGADGHTAFYSRRQSWLSSAQAADGAAELTVESVTLDTALSRLGIGDVDLIKIDVEGAEASILGHSASLRRVAMIIGELHGESACPSRSSSADIQTTATSEPAAGWLRKIGSVVRPSARFVKVLPRSAVNRIKHGLGAVVASNLSALATLWGTDKAPGHHDYTRHYAHYLQSRRRSVECVLEVGIGDGVDPSAGGNSLRMWRNYFPRATIYGIDLYEKKLDAEKRITALQADQSDPEALRRVVDPCPMFDLVVDDGSHIGSHVIATFRVLFPKVRPGGYYAIEDLETSYLPAYGGGPPGAPRTAAALAKELLDDVNVGPRPVAAIHAYPGLILIEKAGDGVA